MRDDDFNGLRENKDSLWAELLLELLGEEECSSSSSKPSYPNTIEFSVPLVDEEDEDDDEEEDDEEDDEAVGVLGAEPPLKLFLIMEKKDSEPLSRFVCS